MRCSNAQRQIAEMVAGELPVWRQRAVQRHCRACPLCRAEWERTRQLWAGLSNLASTPTPNAVRPAVFTALSRPTGWDRMEAGTGRDVDIPVSSNSHKTKEIAMQKRLAMATAAILITTITGTLTAQMLRRNAESAQTADWRAADQQRLVALHEGMTSPETDAGNLAKAQEMRARWKPWAVAHRSALRRMLQAEPQGLAAWQRVYELLPTYLPDHGDGLTIAQLDSKGLPFTWQPVAKGDLQPSTDPTQNRLKAQELHGTNKILQQNFAQFRDIMLSRSMKPGRNVSFYALWASGRITATTMAMQQTTSAANPLWVRDHSQPRVILETTQIPSATNEVAPPYYELYR